MIKFTCKALGVEPYTGNEIVFNDVKSKDAAYINAAYNEYLTEGIGGHYSDKSLQFGFGKTSTRAELATMALRIQSYKKDPVAFKAEKAAERTASEEAYKKEMSNYEIWNGYKIPKPFLTCIAKNTGGDFHGWVWWSQPKNFDTMQAVLSSKLDKNVVKQAIEYGKTKKEDVNLPHKEFKSGKYTLYVHSAPTSTQVTFEILKEQ